MASWREWVLTKIGPPVPLYGVTFGKWQRLLRNSRWGVERPYLIRAASTTVSSIANSAYAFAEDKLYGTQVINTRIEPPLIILGHWRHGTTHLHNLLALDDRFAYPNTFQVAYPNTFLCTEAINARLGAFFLTRTRPMDNVRVGFAEPAEDEFATCCMANCSPYLAMVFPRRRDDFDSLLTFRGVCEDIVAQWKAALVLLLKKLTCKYRRPLVLKSPPHTCRIRLLLEMFPDARFVHICRNPFDVFQSTCHWLRSAAPWWALQRPDFSDLEQRVLQTYVRMYHAFFEERPLIPAGSFCEIRFESLEADPIGQMRQLYDALNLSDFGHVEPALVRYVASLTGYQKNTFPHLCPALQAQVTNKWRRSFEEWGYSRRL